MRAKVSVLGQALTGHCTAHHAFLLDMMPGRVDALTGRSPAVPAARSLPATVVTCRGVSPLHTTSSFDVNDRVVAAV